MQFRQAHYILDFRFEAKTSRETMRHKDTWFIKAFDEDTGRYGIGEAPFFESLNPQNRKVFIEDLRRLCVSNEISLLDSPIIFGAETASDALTPIPENNFTNGSEGIPINGLIWMGDRREMLKRIDEKLSSGFKVLKLKIGGIDFSEEISLLRYIRQKFSVKDLELRLDANGCFKNGTALELLKQLSDFDIHSIEQPVKAGQADIMAELCRTSPIPIALDEELIGVRSYEEKIQMLEKIRPQYIILKPSLCGGLRQADEWIGIAQEKGIGWWATSALESNVGLSAIAVWLSTKSIEMPQGLGTGLLYLNNVDSPLELRGDRLYYNPNKRFVFPVLQWQQ